MLSVNSNAFAKVIINPVGALHGATAGKKAKIKLIYLMLCGKQGVLHKRHDSHRADATRYRGYIRALWRNILKVDIAF